MNMVREQVYWLLRGWEVFAEEMTDWLDCGKWFLNASNPALRNAWHMGYPGFLRTHIPTTPEQHVCLA